MSWENINLPKQTSMFSYKIYGRRGWQKRLILQKNCRLHALLSDIAFIYIHFKGRPSAKLQEWFRKLGCIYFSANHDVKFNHPRYRADFQHVVNRVASYVLREKHRYNTCYQVYYHAGSMFVYEFVVNKVICFCLLYSIQLQICRYINILFMEMEQVVNMK